MAITGSIAKTFRDDRIAALRSLSARHRLHNSKGQRAVPIILFIASVMACGLTEHSFQPGGDPDLAALFFFGATTVAVALLFSGASSRLMPLLDRAEDAGVPPRRTVMFVLLEFACMLPVLALAGGVAFAFLILLRFQILPSLLLLATILSWWMAALSFAVALAFLARRFRVTPGSLALGVAVLCLALVIGPPALSGRSLLPLVPVTGWTAAALLRILGGQMVPAFHLAVAQAALSVLLLFMSQWRR